LEKDDKLIGVEIKTYQKKLSQAFKNRFPWVKLVGVNKDNFL